MHVARHAYRHGGLQRPGLSVLLAAVLLVLMVAPALGAPPTPASPPTPANAPTSVPGADLVRIYIAPGSLSPAALTTTAVDATLAAFRVAMLAEINARRAEAGAPPVIENVASGRRHAAACRLPRDERAAVGYVRRWRSFSGVMPRSPGSPASGRPSSTNAISSRGTRYPWREDVLRIKAPGNPLPTGPVWTAQRVVRTWIDAPLHRRSIFDPEVRDIGFGYAQNIAQDPVSLKDVVFQAYVLDVGTGPLQAGPGVALRLPG